MNFRIEEHSTVASTNTLLQERARQGAPEGTVIIAAEQTAGRGRMQRPFFSPEGTGLYMSILLRPSLTADQMVFLTPAAAVAVSDAILSVTGIEVGIKWVNDLFYKKRKICGILTEASFGSNGRLTHAVLGIGINLAEPIGGFPENLCSIAGGLLEEASEEIRHALAQEILRRIDHYYTRLPETAFLTAYRDRSVLIGKEVTVHRGNNHKKATAIAIDDRCRLIVHYPDGTADTLAAGEVSLKPDQLTDIV